MEHLADTNVLLRSVQRSVSGANVHDARLVAAMNVNGLTSIVTFNVDDFQRYPGIRVLHPREVTAGAE